MTHEPASDDGDYPKAHTERRSFSAIWLIPIIAGLIAAYLGWHDYAEHGPLVTVAFRSAQGLIPGQTQVKYKDVALGTVENIRLQKDLSNVIADIRMTAGAKSLLTDQTRFWIASPALNIFNPSDIQTLVSGSYIQMQPGLAGNPQRHFTALDNPPTDRSDEPGKIFTLKTERLGSLSIGSPVYFRDVNAGQILGYDVKNAFDPVLVTVFIRDPYSKYLREKSRFWNVSGISLNFGPNGLRLETSSLRSFLGGGVAFSTPPEAQNDPPAQANTVFDLYDDQEAAEASTYRAHIAYVTYFQASVKDLFVGSPVLIYGIQVGQVTGLKLLIDPQNGPPKVRVDFELQPGRVFGSAVADETSNITGMMRQLTGQGMRVRLESANLLTGQKMLVLEFVPNAQPAPLVSEGDITVLPSAGAGDNMIDALGDLANKLNQIPFEDIGNHLDHLMKFVDQTVASDDVKQSVHDLSVALSNAADLSRKANANMTPALQRLPNISAQVQQAVGRANTLLDGLDSSYGAGSDFQRDSKLVLEQANEAARSIRLLADFLERHPEALLEGKSYEKDKQ